jgi:hypothetical protein
MSKGSKTYERVMAEMASEVREAVLRVEELARAGMFDKPSEWAEVEGYLRYHIDAIAEKGEGLSEEDRAMMRRIAREGDLVLLLQVTELIRATAMLKMREPQRPFEYLSGYTEAVGLLAVM